MAKRIETDGNTTIVEAAGGCLSPVRLGLIDGYAFDRSAGFTDGRKEYFEVRGAVRRTWLNARCRHCPVCTAYAQHYWTERAVAEYRAAKLSILGTLTFSDLWFAEKWRERQQNDVDQLQAHGCEAAAVELTFNEAPEFSERARAEELGFLGRELQLYLKRIRELGFRFRFMCSTEFGRKNGRPHFHFVMHFSEGSFRKVRKVLLAQWQDRVGIANVKRITDEQGCGYSAKYLGKQFRHDDGIRGTGGMRVRASLKYGHPPEVTKTK